MTVRVHVQADFAAFRAGLDDLRLRQLPYATRRALTDTVRIAEAEMRADLPRVFDRPTPFTERGFYSKPATGKAGAEARAFLAIKDFAPKGTPASRYLAPEILGGGRGVKRFERRLDAAVPMPDDTQTLPARGAVLDAYGNMDRKQLGALLGHLRAFSDTGQNVSARKLAKLAKRGQVVKTDRGLAKFFVAVSKQDGRPLGVWNILGRGMVVPVLLFARKAPTYRPRLDFFGFAERSYRAHFMERLRVRLAEAVATAR